jgi:hypothetical protein
LRPAATAGTVQPPARHDGHHRVDTPIPWFDCGGRPFVPTCRLQSIARKRGPGCRVTAPARCAGAQRPGRREHGAMLTRSGVCSLPRHAPRDPQIAPPKLDSG